MTAHQVSMFDQLLGSEIVATAAVSDTVPSYDPNCVKCRYTRPGGPDHRAHVEPSAPRVFDDAGAERCPSCGSELKRGKCPGACSRIGAEAQTLPIDNSPEAVTARREMFRGLGWSS